MKKLILLLIAALAVGKVSAQNNSSNNKDTTLYTTSQYKVPRNSTVDQLLIAIKDFSIDADGALTHDGQLVKTLTINGKRYGGLDVASVVKTMPTNLVQNVEIIDDYKDAARDGIKRADFNKQLNINTKPKSSYQLYDVLAALHVKPFEELMAMRRGTGRPGRSADAEFFAPAQRMLVAFNNNFYEVDDYGDQIPHFLIKPKPEQYTSLSFERNAFGAIVKQEKPVPASPKTEISKTPVQNP